MSESDFTTRPLRIVVIEDEVMFLELISSVLSQDQNVEVVGRANSLEQGRELVLYHKPDVVILDIELGAKLNGIQLSLQLRKLLPKLGIVLLSNHTYPQFAKTLSRKKLFGWAYLLKKSGSDLKTLKRAIISVSQCMVMLDEELTNKLKYQSNTHVLTDRQKEIMRLVSQGHSNKKIADMLELKNKTVENTLGDIYSKLGIPTKEAAIHARVAAVLKYLENS